MATSSAIRPEPALARRVAVFLPSLDPGGAERAMLTVANAVAARGHLVDLVLASATGAFKSEVSNRVRVVDLRQRRVGRALPGLARYLRSEAPEVLLSAMPHCNLIALAAGMFAGGRIRIVVNEQASAAGCCQYEPRKYRLFRIGALLAYRRAGAIITVSEAMVHEFPRAVAIHNPVDLDGARVCAAENPQHSWAAEPFVLAVGRLVPQKDFATLIQAFAQLGGDVRLIILGEGPERPKLERLVDELRLGNRVSLPGFDPNPFAYMALAKLFVLSSRYEGLPGVLIQAMACGRPVVATDCPTGPREILEDGRWGDLVPVGDPAALSAAIDAALARQVHPDVRRRAGDYSVEAAVEKYLEVLLPGEARVVEIAPGPDATTAADAGASAAAAL